MDTKDVKCYSHGRFSFHRFLADFLRREDGEKAVHVNNFLGRRVSLDFSPSAEWRISHSGCSVTFDSFRQKGTNWTFCTRWRSRRFSHRSWLPGSIDPGNHLKRLALRVVLVSRVDHPSTQTLIWTISSVDRIRNMVTPGTHFNPVKCTAKFAPCCV